MYHKKMFDEGATLPQLVRAEIRIPLWFPTVARFTALVTGNFMASLIVIGVAMRLLRPDWLPVWEPVAMIGLLWVFTFTVKKWAEEKLETIADFLDPVRGVSLVEGSFKGQMEAAIIRHQALQKKVIGEGFLCNPVPPYEVGEYHDAVDVMVHIAYCMGRLVGERPNWL